MKSVSKDPALKASKSAKCTIKSAVPPPHFNPPSVSDEQRSDLHSAEAFLNQPILAVPQHIRLNNCYSEWLGEQAAKELDPSFKCTSNRALSARHNINESSLRYRIQHRVTKAQDTEERQRLSHLEEESVKDWCIQLEKWGFPARIESLRMLVTTMLQAKGDHQELGCS